MATLTAFLGLCGSGKTYLAGQVAGAQVFDESLFAKRDDLLAALKGGQDCVVTEIAFCRPEKCDELLRLLAARAPGTTVV